MIAEWRARAACADYSAELWFPNKGGSSEADRYDVARQVCHSCPVIGDCLRTAQAEEAGRGRNHRFGMRGGLTPRERFALHQRNPQAHADTSSACSPIRVA